MASLAQDVTEPGVQLLNILFHATVTMHYHPLGYPRRSAGPSALPAVGALLALLALGACARGPGAGGTASSPERSRALIEVRVDHRVELLAIVFRLAGAPEYSMQSFPRYAAAIDTFFGPYRDHAAVQLAKRLRQRGIAHDAVMSLAVHATAVPSLGERHPLDASELDPRWNADDARELLQAVADFAAVSDAPRFFSEQAPMYAAAEQRLRTMIATQQMDGSWFGRFFGADTAVRLIAVVAPGNGTWAYGIRYHGPRGARELYAVMNVWQHDSAGLPTFPPTTANVLVHEFNHSFVNPVVEADTATVMGAAREIHARLRRQLSPQGYSEPRTLITESLVRAAAARYVLATHGADSASRELEAERLRGFLWIRELFALLGSYEQSRSRFDSYAEFHPLAVAYFNDLAPRIDAMLAQFDAERPTVISTLPRDGEAVDASLRQLVIRFDQPMRGSWATLPTDGGRELFPAITNHAFDDSGTTFTISVRLEPGRQYELTLNSEQITGFVSRRGIALAPYRLRFRTP